MNEAWLVPAACYYCVSIRKVMRKEETYNLALDFAVWDVDHPAGSGTPSLGLALEACAGEPLGNVLESGDTVDEECAGHAGDDKAVESGLGSTDIRVVLGGNVDAVRHGHDDGSNRAKVTVSKVVD